MKIKKNKTVLYKTSSKKSFSWGEIKDFQFEDDDIINAGWEEPHNSENESSDGHYYFIVNRMIEETDDEYEKRLAENIRYNEISRKKRYEQYLKLKKEFVK